MIDFTNCEKNNFKYYGGKNGGKICVIYNNENYMLKFPAINEELKKIELAPIYDCVSCLYPQLTDERIAEIIDDENEMEARVYIFPTSALKSDDKKINYFIFISGFENEDCNNALLRIFPRIDMEKIYKVIDETPYISEIRKRFYKKILKMRYEMILKLSYEELTKV